VYVTRTVEKESSPGGIKVLEMVVMVSQDGVQGAYLFDRKRRTGGLHVFHRPVRPLVLTRGSNVGSVSSRTPSNSTSTVGPPTTVRMMFEADMGFPFIGGRRACSVNHVTVARRVPALKP
jgi:hypothetical protein